MPAVAHLVPEDREKKGSDHEPRRSAADGLPVAEFGTYLLALELAGSAASGCLAGFAGRVFASTPSVIEQTLKQPDPRELPLIS